jgi:hypothetical protein
MSELKEAYVEFKRIQRQERRFLRQRDRARELLASAGYELYAFTLSSYWKGKFAKYGIAKGRRGRHTQEFWYEINS